MKMNDEQMLEFIEQLYPYFIKKYKQDNSFTQTAQMVDAKVMSISKINKNKAVVKVNPYDDDEDTIIVPIKTTDPIQDGDSVRLLFKESLKDAVIIMKN